MLWAWGGDDTVFPGIPLPGNSAFPLPTQEGGMALAVGVGRVAESKWQVVGGGICRKRISEMANLLSGGGLGAGPPRLVRTSRHIYLMGGGDNGRMHTG